MARKRRGQDKRGRSAGGEKFVKMHLRTMQTPAWRALSPYAQRLYPWLVMEWDGPRENNNGRIQFSVRQAAEALDCNTETARKALADLQRKGFIVVTRCAALGTEGHARGHEYELTEFGRPGQVNDRENTAPRKLYLDWKPGKEFDVAKAATHNPTGRGGLKNKTLTYDISPAQLTGPEGPDLHGKTKSAEKGYSPTYAVSHPYMPGGVGETGKGDHCEHYHQDTYCGEDLTSPGARGEAARRVRDLEAQAKTLNGHQPTEPQLAALLLGQEDCWMIAEQYPGDRLGSWAQRVADDIDRITRNAA